MRGWIATLALVAGCGRLGFATDGEAGADAPDAPRPDAGGSPDSGPCTAVGHDEDGDGVDDACDSCPQVGGAQTDSDGDGVGDPCDDDPGRQTLAFFDPFTGLSSEWQYYLGDYTLDGDALSTPTVAASAQQVLRVRPASDRLTVVGTIEAADTTTAQIVVGVGPTDGSRVYYCELYEDTGGFYLGYTYTTTDAQYVIVDKQPLAGTIANHDYELELIRHSPNFGCATTRDGTRYTVMGTIPDGIAADNYYMSEFHVVAHVQSFTRISY